MNSLPHDFRLALRKLRLSPGFTAVAVLTIGIGIGANTTLFSWLRPLLLDPLPGAADPSRLVALENVAGAQNSRGDPLATSFLDFRDYRDYLRLLDVAAVGGGNGLTLGADSDQGRIWCELVSGNFFAVLGLQPEAGRFFSPAEQSDTQNAAPVAVISDDFWRAHFNRRPSAIGSTLRIDRVAFTVIGVAPADFHGTQSGFAYQVWLPLAMYGAVTHSGTWMLQDRGTRNFTMIARLHPGVSLAQAREEVQTLAGRMAAANGTPDQGVGATVLPLWQWHFGSQAMLLKPVAILMAACGLLLLIVCANVANLLLARATGRQKEFSIRLALGASPGRLARQLLTESLLLAVAGSVLGLLIARWLGGALRWLLPAIAGPALIHPALAGQVFGFSAALTLAVAGIAGLIPAVHAARSNAGEMLKAGGRGGSTGAPSHRGRNLLVIAEMALAVVTLVGAGMLFKSYQGLRQMTPGFSAEGQVLVQLNLSTAGYTRAQADALSARVTERLGRYPGVTGVSYADTEPLGFKGANWESLEVEGYRPAPGENMKIDRNLIGPGYFQVMKIPLTAGRDFDARDNAASPGMMIVSQEFVRRFIPGRDPIGRKVHGWGRWFTIVGVAGDIKIQRIDEGARPFFYVPIRQVYRPEYGLTFHLRTSGAMDEAIAAVRREVAAFDPALTVFDAQPMTDYISGSLFGQRIATAILSILAILALALAAMGLYSVLAYSVAQRTSEIGIRMALGARTVHVLTLVLRQGLGLAASGFAVGVGAAFTLCRLGSSLGGMLRPADPESCAAAALFTLVVALIAVAVPAWKALRVDPVAAIRNQ